MAEAQNYFDQVWASADVREARRGRVSIPDQVETAVDLDSMAVTVRRRMARLGSGRDWRRAGRAVFDMRFVPGPDVEETLTLLINRARHSIVIENPYVVLTQGLFAALLRARARGVTVRLITNSYASNNQWLAHAAYESTRARLLGMGIFIEEYSGPQTLHAKTLVVDERIVHVGSINWDPRSMSINTETAVEFESRDIAVQALVHMNRRAEGRTRVVGAADPCASPRILQVLGRLLSSQL